MENMELRKVLIKIGIASNVKGFHYILEAINIIQNRPTHTKITYIYQTIGEKFNDTSSRTERAIRHAIEKSYKENGILKKIYSTKPDNLVLIYDLIYNFDIFLDVIKE